MFQKSALRGFVQTRRPLLGCSQVCLFSTLRQSTHEVELNGQKITSIVGDQALGQIKQQGASDEVGQRTVLFLHGLLGQGRMWRSFALNDVISKQCDVFLVDLRNHGDSDHHASMTYEEMASDLKRFIESRELENVTIIGHNIGAKTAMVTATMFPNLVNGVISLDTAPVASAEDKKLQTLQSVQQIRSLDIAGKSRKDAIDLIKSVYKDEGVANFVANNLVYSESDDHQTVKWGVNMDAIHANIDQLTGYPSELEPKYDGLTYFLNGSLSVQYDDQVYLKQFPKARLAEIEGAGHYVHQDKGQTTLQLIGECLHEIYH